LLRTQSPRNYDPRNHTKNHEHFPNHFDFFVCFRESFQEMLGSIPEHHKPSVAAPFHRPRRIAGRVEQIFISFDRFLWQGEHSAGGSTALILDNLISRNPL